MSEVYRIPKKAVTTEITIANSRFITLITRANTVDEAKKILADVRSTMPDANHHVYAYRIGFGNSVIEGMSDDGEPSGTSGPPTLAILRGTDIGDIIIVTTRYFGGTKLGTGGLVRAYSDSARTALDALETELKIPKRTLGIELPYSLYEQTKRLIAEFEGEIADETFEADVMLMVIFPETQIAEFTERIRDLSAGGVVPIDFGEA